MYSFNPVCSTGALNLTHETFHSIVAPTVVDTVGCVGSETVLTDCSYDSIVTCGPLNDAGVVCQGTHTHITVNTRNMLLLY